MTNPTLSRMDGAWNDDSTETTEWSPRKVLEVGLRVHDNLQSAPWDRIALTVPQAKALLSNVSEKPAHITEVIGSDGKGVAAQCAIDGCALKNAAPQAPDTARSEPIAVGQPAVAAHLASTERTVEKAQALQNEMDAARYRWLRDQCGVERSVEIVSEHQGAMLDHQIDKGMCGL